MTLRMKAFISGIVIEGILFSLMYWIDGWGPCGPSSSFGFVLMLFHFPGSMLAIPFAWMHLPSSMDAPVLFVCSSVWWIFISYAFLVTRDRRMMHVPSS